VDELLNEEYLAHDAFEDVRALKHLTETHTKVNHLLDHSFTTEWACSIVDYTYRGRQNDDTLAPLVDAKAISKGMATKAAQSGLQLSHLKLVYNRSGREGLQQLMEERDAEDKPRVTDMKRIHDSVCEWLALN
jgi:hypothetical protein